MIPLIRHLTPNLAALLDEFLVDTRTHPAGGSLSCDVVTIADTDAARSALTAYHRERWNRPRGAAGPSGTRLSDLAELVAALMLHHHRIHDPQDIYPLTFTSPSPSTQLGGIDVIGATIHMGIGALSPDDRLSIAEAKSTLDKDAANAISGIQADVRKCDAERMSDSLFVLKWIYERTGDLNHLRLHLFVAGHTSLVGSILCDPNLCDMETTVASIFNRLEDMATPTGAPLTRVVLFALPDAEAFIEATL